ELIASAVTLRVIDRLETVDVDEGEHERLVGAFRLDDLAFELHVARGPEIRTRQLVNEQTDALSPGQRSIRCGSESVVARAGALVGRLEPVVLGAHAISCRIEVKPTGQLVPSRRALVALDRPNIARASHVVPVVGRLVAIVGRLVAIINQRATRLGGWGRG